MAHDTDNKSTERVEQTAALRCIELIKKRRSLNEGERDLLASLENDIRVSFDLEGAVRSANLTSADNTPGTWFW